MAWVRASKKGATGEDGNDVQYPILTPSQSNKLYKEADINNIALAIGGTGLKVSDMPQAIADSKGGMDASRLPIYVTEYTTV